jgi:tRNA1Val (adenine37-N6)-methyltransferase
MGKDTLFGGALTLHQPARGEGYRVNVDALLLAWFAGAPRRAARVVDLGAGVGAVGLCLLHLERAGDVLFVEREPPLSRLSMKNLSANGWESRGSALVADVGDPEALASVRADLVVCNPPYVAPGRGRSPVVGKGARMGELGVFVTAARRILGRGRACFVYPASELTTLLGTLRSSGLEPKRLSFVHSRAEEPARVALVEAVPGKRGGLVVSPPLIERTEEGPTAMLAAIVAGTRTPGDGPG